MRRVYLLISLLFLLLEAEAQFTAPAWTWANPYPVTSRCITHDSFGNLYMVGNGPASMTFPPYTLAGPDLFIAKFTAAGTTLWARGFGATPNKAAYSISVDPSGNLFITGIYNDTLLVVGTDTLRNSGIWDNIFISKLDANNGNIFWTRGAGGVRPEMANSIKADNLGNAYLTGSFGSDSISFGTHTLHRISPFGYGDVFIAKYDANGNATLARNFGGLGGAGGVSITLDLSNNIYLAGEFSTGPVNFDSYTVTNNGTPIDVFLVKFDPNINTLWAKAIAGSSSDRVFSVATDSSGNAFVAGEFKSASITTGSVTLSITTQTANDMYLIKFDPNGNAVWGRQTNNPNKTSARCVTTNGDNNIYLAGAFYWGSIAFGNTTLFNGNSSNGPNVFLTKYDKWGNIVWAKSASGDGNDQPSSITANPQGEYITGSYTTIYIRFDNMPQLNAFTGSSAFFARLPEGASTTSINESSDSKGISLFPNPSKGIFTIVSTISSGEIFIYNMMGEKVISQRVVSEKSEFDLSSFPKGIYFVNIVSGSENISRKIILH